MKLPLLLCLVAFSLNLFAQQRFQVNYGVDTSNEDNKAILKKWEKYIKYDADFLSREQHADFKEYWSAKSIEKHKYPDLLNHSSVISPSLLANGFSNKVITVAKRNNYFFIKSIFYYSESDSVFVPVAITNYPLKKENNDYYFYNALDINTREWKEKRVGKILYHYKPDHRFNTKIAQKANEAYQQIASLFALKTDLLIYYIFDSCDDLYNTLGFDYRIGMGGENNRCGHFDTKNNIIYTGGYENPEFHEHELIHIINNSFTNSHDWFLTGISGYWGGHFGKSLQYHLERVNDYIKKNPDINLNNLLEYEKLDDFTNPIYVFGGIFCHLALQKNGIQGLKRLLNHGTNDDDFYKALEKELNIPRNMIHKEITKLLEEYSINGLHTISYKDLLKR